MNRTRAALGLAVLALLAAGCSHENDGQGKASSDTSTSPSTTPPVKVIEPEIDDKFRFDHLISETFKGMEKVDIANFQGGADELTQAMYGDRAHFRVVGINLTSENPEFCFRDIKHKTWFASHADTKGDRAVFLLGDGDECSLIPEEAVSISELADDEFKKIKGPAAPFNRLKQALAFPESAKDS